MNVSSVGVDAVDIARFRALVKRGDSPFMRKTFSARERAYCVSYKDSAPHFAGTFAAKEAIQKALGSFTIPLKDLEIRRAASGKPDVWVRGKRSRSVLVSITHSKDIACAVALKRV